MRIPPSAGPSVVSWTAISACSPEPRSRQRRTFSYPSTWISVVSIACGESGFWRKFRVEKGAHSTEGRWSRRGGRAAKSAAGERAVGRKLPARSDGGTMIRPREHASDSARGAAPMPRLVYCTLWTSGPDPAQDGLVRLSAASADGAQVLDLLCAPFPGAPGSWGCEERLRREFGLEPEELAGAADPARAWEELARLALGATLVVADLEGFEVW